MLFEFLAGLLGGLVGVGILSIVGFKLILPKFTKKLIENGQFVAQQLRAVDSRVSRTAQQKIGKDVIQNTPLGAILQFLSEDTVNYLLDHPEALPDVLKKWLPLINLGKDLIPIIMQQIEKTPKNQWDL